MGICQDQKLSTVLNCHTRSQCLLLLLFRDLGFIEKTTKEWVIEKVTKRVLDINLASYINSYNGRANLLNCQLNRLLPRNRDRLLRRLLLGKA